MGYIELEAFSMRDGVSRETFLAVDAAMQEWSYLHRDQLVRRTTAFGDEGSVLVLSLFGGAAPPSPADPDAAPPRAFTDVINTSSYRAKIYRDLD